MLLGTPLYFLFCTEEGNGTMPFWFPNLSVFWVDFQGLLGFKLMFPKCKFPCQMRKHDERRAESVWIESVYERKRDRKKKRKYRNCCFEFIWKEWIILNAYIPCNRYTYLLKNRITIFQTYSMKSCYDLLTSK